MNNTGRVALVGSGCGTIDWFTLKGLELVRNCDAVVYDDLIDPAILAEVPSTARKIYMGKRCGRESAVQTDIQSTLVDLAKEGLNVVRLKGGDPFVFGRGGEELIALNEAGIPWTVVPGISSSIAIPEEAGIPVTHRGLSRSLHIITAHTKEDSGPEDIETLAKLRGTLVFLMGLGALPNIAKGLIENGKRPDTPAAVLSGGNSTHPARVVGTLSDICEKASLANVVSPAVIVVGDVAGLGLSENSRSSLRGKIVGLTGTDDFRRKTRAALSHTGARCISLMSAAPQPTSEPIDWDRIAHSPNSYLVFTSGQGVDLFFKRVNDDGFDLRALASCKFAVIGNATAASLRAHGFNADIMPEQATSESLAAALSKHLDRCATVFTMVSRKGSSVVETQLTKLGISVHRCDIYDVTYECAPVPVQPDIIIFGSAGGVRALYDSGFTMSPDIKCVCIGPVCAKALEDTFGNTPILSDDISVNGIVSTLEAM